MRRVMIVGGPGAGKTTLAMVGQSSALAAGPVDRMFWQKAKLLNRRNEVSVK